MQKSHIRTLINCERPGGTMRDRVPVMVLSEAQPAQNFTFRFDMLLQTAPYGTGQTPNYDSGPEPGSNHLVDKELGTEDGDQLFPISSEQRVRGNGFKRREGFGLFMAEFPDSEGC